MATFYISPTGDDTTGDGSEGSPWFNLPYAINNSGSTDTIIVKEGSYTQTLGLFNVYLGSRTIKSENLNPVATELDFDGLTIERITSDIEASIEGIKFIRMKSTNPSQSIFSPFNGQYIRNCIFEDCRGNNNVRGRGGIFQGGNTRIEGCKFINCWSNTSGVDTGGIFSSKGINGYVTTVKNCLIYFDGTAIPVGEFIPTVITLGDGSNPREIIFDNSIVTVKGGTTTFSYIRFGNGTVTVSNSDIHNANYGSSNFTTSTNVITDDPKLVDPDNGFYGLSVDSPAIGLGQM